MGQSSIKIHYKYYIQCNTVRANSDRKKRMLMRMIPAMEILFT